MASDGPPMPSPSSAPLEMTEREEITNPMLIRRRAVLPAAIVSALSEKRPMSWSGIAQQSAVPTAMIAAESRSATR